MKERRPSSTIAGQEEPAPSSGIGRRSFVRTATVGGAAAAALAATGLGGSSALAATSGRAAATSSSAPTLQDAGAGMHTGIGTVQMLACASISRELVTCSVGQMGLDFTELSVLDNVLGPVLGPLFGPGFSGPFAMEMYSLNVASYDINRPAGVITAMGVVRSITKIAGILIEDATSPYLAVATDGSRTGQPDTYHLSFTTPFWSTPGNPLATPSTYHKGWSMFGGNLIIGEVSVPQ